MVVGPSVGRGYWKKRQELRDAIRKGTISALETCVEEMTEESGIERFACYFCGDNIQGEMYVLDKIEYVKGHCESRARYYIDKECYLEAKTHEFIGKEEIKVCLN